MDRIAGGIVKHRKLVIVIFLLACVVSIFTISLVDVNYNMVEYLPDEAESTIGMDIMREEFDQSSSYAYVMVNDVSLVQALEYKEKLAAIDGVESVTWLDDVADISQPLAMLSASLLEAYYKDGAALFTVAVQDGRESGTCAEIRALIGDGNAMSGEAIDTASTQNSTSSEVANAVLILVPIIILILLLSSGSWLEPVLFLGAIGVSVLINMGTNVIFGEISFMTNAIAPILQLAVSLDYAIFLLHSFSGYRQEYDDVEVAMRHAITASMKTVAASAMTTLFGFLALVFMDFKIGADLGLSLAKGILLSFLSVVVFLPALTLSLVKYLDKTRHRPFLPSFTNAGRFFTRLAIPIVVIVAIVIVPCFLGQSETEFLYGSGTADESTQYGSDQITIEELFGQNTSMVLLVPRGDAVREQELCRALDGLDFVKSVTSYVTSVGAVIPSGYLSDDIVSQFYSENHARIILSLDTPQEGDEAFAAVEAVRGLAYEYYGEGTYTVGQSANLYDIKTTVQADNERVNMLAVIAIFLVLLVSFRSATLPFILLLTIETAIWINMAVPYFMGSSINFIGYLVISTVQLGATVDYAILLTDNFMQNRRLMPKREAIHKSLGDSFKSILVSASTLSVAGFTLYMTSSDPRVSDIGLLLGRGTLISMAMVVCFLPAMLLLFDKLNGKLTWRSRFYMQGPIRPPGKETKPLGKGKKPPSKKTAASRREEGVHS